jgi:hypothetical protein
VFAKFTSKYTSLTNWFFSGAKFRVVIDSAESSFAPFDQNTMPTHIINDNQNGTYGIFYSLHKPGKYIIEITCNNVPLKGSPFEISVSPGMTSA